jgi:hypothetical protein
MGLAVVALRSETINHRRSILDATRALRCSTTTTVIVTPWLLFLPDGHEAGGVGLAGGNIRPLGVGGVP